MISHKSAIMLAGSCFSDNIGSRLNRDLFNVNINPFGTLYNPLSILSAIERIAAQRRVTADETFLHGNLYHSFLCHSSLSSVSQEKMLADINARIAVANSFMRNCNILILTLGSAYVYIDKLTDKVVANCHKLPQSQFTQKRLSIDECADAIISTIKTATALSPQLKTILTVSPIRHLAYGAHDNQLSKSTLLLAVEKVRAAFPGNVIYFPSYEIMMDDLRDYRFYGIDMCHPADIAIDYIYECFGKAFFNNDTISLSRNCQKLWRRTTHRPLTDDNESIAAFRRQTMEIATGLLREHPYLINAYNNNDITTL